MTSGYVRNEKIKRVKNLGWLRRHQQEVAYCVYCSPLHIRSEQYDALFAYLEDGTVYYTAFADRNVFINKFDSHNKIFEGVVVYTWRLTDDQKRIMEEIQNG